MSGFGAQGRDGPMCFQGLKQVGRQVCGLEARAVMGGDAGEADGSGPAEPCRSHADLWDSGCWMESCGEPRKTPAMVRASECGEWTEEAVWAGSAEAHWGEVPWAVCSSRVRSRIVFDLSEHPSCHVY